MMTKPDYSGKRLFLLRHATAKPSSDNGDIGRSLAPNGVADAIALGTLMLEKKYIPDIVLCSPARRTRETLEALQKSLINLNILAPQILYDGMVGDYLNEIQNIDNEHNDVLIIAHNPSIHQLAAMLAGHGADTALQRLITGYPPATLSIIHCNSNNWADIQPEENTLAAITAPIDYNAPARPTRWM